MVFDKWKSDFENLYSCNSDSEFDQTFYEQIKTHKLLLENEMLDPLYVSNLHLNSNITLSEISMVIKNAKKQTSCGIDKIRYDVLKNFLQL